MILDEKERPYHDSETVATGSSWAGKLGPEKPGVENITTDKYGVEKDDKTLPSLPPADSGPSTFIPSEPTSHRTESPPSYDYVLSSSSPDVAPQSRVSATSPRTSDAVKTSTLTAPQPITFPEPAGSWLSSKMTGNKLAKEVQALVWGHFRDLVRQTPDPPLARAREVISSCQVACKKHGLVLSDLLQEKEIEDHTALYWVIITRPTSSYPAMATVGREDFLTLLLHASAPLSAETIGDMRNACLATYDQSLLQRLQQTSEWLQATGQSQMMFSSPDSIPRDHLAVLTSDDPSEDAAFVVSFAISKLHQRILVSKEIAFEFIAKSRIWRLRFCIAEKSKPCNVPDGTWCFALSILEQSPPTFLDSQLLFLAPANRRQGSNPLPMSKPSPSLSRLSPPSSSSSPIPRAPSFTSLFSKAKLPKTDALRLRSDKELASATSKKQRGGTIIEIAAPISDSALGESVQSPDSALYGPSGELRCRWEVRLGKPETNGECIIS